uniref:Cytochrome b5 heme-binding domain-containing protein n=1 Tax=Globisporangium ultimum (strain ATCC 200006 / CBS 805.95 / DAOM BR144) TaxID=431595 RepID=K3WRJ9_GLOUD
MPWTANNNQAGEIRAPAITAALRAKKLRDSESAGPLRTYSQSLRVLALDELAGVDPSAVRFCALLHPDDFPTLLDGADDIASRTEFIFPRVYAQFVIPVRPCDAAPHGCVALSQVQMINLELCVGQVEQWTLFQEKVPTINAIAIEIRPLPVKAAGRSGDDSDDDEDGDDEDDNEEETMGAVPSKVVTDAKDFATAFAKYTWQRILTENERLVLTYKDGREYFVRVLEIDAEDESETEFTMPDSFRGIVDEETQVFVSADSGENDASFELLNASVFSATNSLASQRTDVVTVITNDEEEFPVKKKLLFPCIKLSSAVLSGKGVHKDSSTTIEVDIDCLTFDRVLLYLEHEARNDGTEFQFDPSHAEDLLTAATKVGCIGLQEVCQKRLGEFETRVRKESIRWQEVVRRNNSGEVWLVMLGMVFDVTRWLPEHPGGSIIIPEQAVNVDCTVMFEIYHSSRQSFRYLKQFYIGEIDEADLELIPSSAEKPSAAFIEELRQYTTWRITPQVSTFKSF